jgi:type VI secretion system protein ImpK
MSSNLDRRAENLAYCFQEVLTVGERLRANRQHVTDAESFRHQVREAIKTSAEEARRRGYSAEDIQLATFAVVAFLDESILNMHNPVFADWPRRPLQEEYFGHHVAGEIFFQNLDKILQRNDSQDMGDLLEVYQLCMLLGFAGKYSIGGRGELMARVQTTGDKINRIRQMSPELSPAWAAPNDPIRASGADPWVKRLIYIAATVLLITAVLFGVYKMNLGSDVDSMEAIAAQGRSS